MKEIKWTKERPTIEGLYWFYGDIWWGEMNQSPEKFKPKLEVVECRLLNKTVTLRCNANFVSKKVGFGLFSVEPIELPESPDVGVPDYNG